MKLEEIIKTYGKNDYYDMNTGRTYHISEMQYHLFDNTTHVPVSENGNVIGIVKLKGDWTR